MARIEEQPHIFEILFVVLEMLNHLKDVHVTLFHGFIQGTMPGLNVVRSSKLKLPVEYTKFARFNSMRAGSIAPE